MSRLAKRVEVLEAGEAGDGIDVVARVPHSWAEERQTAEVEALAAAPGAEPPFGRIILIQRFIESEGARLISMRRRGKERINGT